MFESVFDETEIETFESFFENIEYSKLFSNVFTFSLLGGLFYNMKKISKHMIKYLLHKPGVGTVNIVSSGKTKKALVNTEIGEIQLSIIKNPSFELSMGFFTENKDFKEGLHVLDQENFPENILLKNVGCYLVTDIEKPRKFRGRSTLFGFIVSYLDDLVYVFKVSNNETIDYKKIFDEYEREIEVPEIKPYFNESEPYCNKTETYEEESSSSENEVCCKEKETCFDENQTFCKEKETCFNWSEEVCKEKETCFDENQTFCKETGVCFIGSEKCCKETEEWLKREEEETY